MKLLTAVICTTFLLIISACSGNRGSETSAPANDVAHQGEAERVNRAATMPAANESVKGETEQTSASTLLTASLTQAGGSQAAQQFAVERKIIRDAEISLEVAAPAEGQRKLASIAEAHGGFVVTSESRQQQGDAARGGQTQEIVSVQMRVPATRFDAALAEIRAVGTRVRAEKTTGKDVTEEFIDLDARLRTQRALETQFLEIMKRASKVSDALEVHSQLAGVRTEIERVEGRRRFLENQAALSTINATLQPPAPLVSANTSGFLDGLRHAFGDGLDIAAAIILSLVRFGIALLPVLLIIVLPLALAWRFLLRPRFRRPKVGTPPVAGATT